MFHKLTPDRILKFKGEKCVDGKLSKKCKCISNGDYSRRKAKVDDYRQKPQCFAICRRFVSRLLRKHEVLDDIISFWKSLVQLRQNLDVTKQKSFMDNFFQIENLTPLSAKRHDLSYDKKLWIMEATITVYFNAFKMPLLLQGLIELNTLDNNIMIKSSFLKFPDHYEILEINFKHVECLFILNTIFEF